MRHFAMGAIVLLGSMAAITGTSAAACDLEVMGLKRHNNLSRFFPAHPAPVPADAGATPQVRPQPTPIAISLPVDRGGPKAAVKVQ